MRQTLMPILLAPFAISMTLHADPDLIRAATKGRLEEVHSLVSSGTPINGADKNGWTPLMWAVYYRQLPVTEYLLRKGADPNVISTSTYRGLPKGVSALIIASHEGLEDEVRNLVNAKARTDISDSLGNTAATYARKNGYDSVLDTLLEGIPLKKTYSKAIIDVFSTKGSILRDYSDEIAKCRQGIMARLLEKKAFETLEGVSANKSYDSSTLMVNIEVTDIRIRSGAARVLFGPMAGTTFMSTEVKLIDASTGFVERKRPINSENNAWASTFTLSGADQSLSLEMGKMIADYIAGATKKQN